MRYIDPKLNESGWDLEKKFQSQKVQFENIKQNYENTINHINKIQLSILDTAFSGKLVK